MSDPDTLIVIAFIQDEENKEILQAVTNDQTSIGTAIEPWLNKTEELNFIIYPNPANNNVFFAFGKNPNANSYLQIINQNGKGI